MDLWNPQMEVSLRLFAAKQNKRAKAEGGDGARFGHRFNLSDDEISSNFGIEEHSDGIHIAKTGNSGKGGERHNHGLGGPGDDGKVDKSVAGSATASTDPHVETEGRQIVKGQCE